uniref:Uncharacterized protein n=1 Tax=Panstrongylus lignarius TaxID=156445 RepID=A0A224XSC5_9HEMI
MIAEVLFMCFDFLLGHCLGKLLLFSCTFFNVILHCYKFFLLSILFLFFFFFLIQAGEQFDLQMFIFSFLFIYFYLILFHMSGT